MPSRWLCGRATTKGCRSVTSWCITPTPAAQYTSFAFTRRLIDAGTAPRAGSVGHAHDNALAETTIGLFKAEMIQPNGPWRTCSDVELATLTWVDWYNNRLS